MSAIKWVRDECWIGLTEFFLEGILRAEHLNRTQGAKTWVKLYFLPPTCYGGTEINGILPRFDITSHLT